MGVVAPILLAVLGSVAAAAMLPNDHAFLKKFGGHLRCPYASKWLQHGPERAAELLNVRRLDDALVGSCTYTNPFAGVEACFEMRGGDWTAASAEARCATAMGASMPSVSGELTYGAGCALPDAMAGWCMTAEHMEASPTALGDDGCDGAATACATWMSGEFVADGACASEETTITAGPRCVIAPGPMGAAHQLGSSAG